jgi:hypothetical protein
MVSGIFSKKGQTAGIKKLPDKNSRKILAYGFRAIKYFCLSINKAWSSL